MSETSKECTRCNKIKNLSEYSKVPTLLGTKAECKICHAERVSLYRRTKGGLVTRIYGGQKSSSKRRGHIPPSYTHEELKKWMFSKPVFHELYNNWALSGYLRRLSPSVDRIDDKEGYSMLNIQLMSWEDNLKKEHNGMRNGEIGTSIKQRPVVRHLENMEVVERYISVAMAARKLKMSHAMVSFLCQKKKTSSRNILLSYEV